MQFDRRNGAGDSIRIETMKTLNPPKRQIRTPVVKPAQPAKTIEQMQAQQHDRMIRRAAERLERSRKLHMEWKAKKAQKTQPPAISPKLSLPKAQPAVVASSATIPPAEAAEPKLSPKAMRSLAHAVACMERPDKSLNQRRLMAHYHLRQHSALSNLNPDDLIFEQSTPNSCSTQSRLASLSGEPRAGL